MNRSTKEGFSMLARCFQGLEETLAGEIAALGGTAIQAGKRAVSFSGDEAVLYRMNLCLRTALDVNLFLFDGEAGDEQQYYQKIKQYRWEDLFRNDLDIHITIAGKSGFSGHSLYLAQKAKDAVADRMREKTGTRPSVGKAENALLLMIHFHGSRFSVWVNTSGEPLFKRGYRDAGSRNRAPLNESLAAGLILLSGWDPSTSFIDLMCGSGTLPIEAAMIRSGIKPNGQRGHFGFMNLPFFSKDIYNAVKHESTSAVESSSVIKGSDQSSNNIRKAKQNLYASGTVDMIELETVDLQQASPPVSPPGTIILNPPYGERMDEDEDILQLYREIGTAFKHNFPGYTAWVFTANSRALNEIGLRPFRRIRLYNGPLECIFAGYKLYQGTKKIHKLQRA